MADVEMSDAPTAGKKTEIEVRKKFEVKKVLDGSSSGLPGTRRRTNKTQWNAVALWAWDIVVDNCAICRNHIMDLCRFDAVQRLPGLFADSCV